MSNQDFYPGKRLCTKGNLCTVRYVGEVRGKPGRWLGVEWDDATRGKHSGTHEGVKYFECKCRTKYKVMAKYELTFQVGAPTQQQARSYGPQQHGTNQGLFLEL